MRFVTRLTAIAFFGRLNEIGADVFVCAQSRTARRVGAPIESLTARTSDTQMSAIAIIKKRDVIVELDFL